MDENIIETEKVYSISKEHCLDMIHMANGVCRQCGGEIVPIETVDNSHNPTFWAGCLECGIFCNGVNPIHYEIGKMLVDKRNYIAYTHMERPKDNPSTHEIWYKDHYRKSQISGAISLVADVLSCASEINMVEEKERFKNKVLEVLKILRWENDGTTEPEDIKKAFAMGARWQASKNLPTDSEVGNWFEENIDSDCSASSAIYKFRLWLSSIFSMKSEI